MKQFWSEQKGGIILLALLLTFVVGRAVYSWVDDLRKERAQARKELREAQEELLRVEEAYRDSLYKVKEDLLNSLQESIIRLENLEQGVNETNTIYGDRIRVIDGYTTIDERINALTRELVLQDSSWNRYLNRDHRRRPR